MKIRIRLFANFEQKMPKEQDETGMAPIELPEGTIVQDILDRFEIPYDDAYIILLNGRHAQKDTPLEDNAELSIFPPIVGG